ncbi:COG1361 S-layer family protein [Methanoregula sp.]|uniref:COG1361 S-layer family protein n=1 Tax=Methanoregula sp. TaxID=2052170 RepID=UPI0025F5FBBD|nr:S-layer protein [Methanoregula sp.]
MRLLRTIIALGVLFALVVAIMPAVQATDAPTVTITSYEVSPSVLMPDSLGTITVTLKNTASSASTTEKSGKLSPDDYTVITTADITVNIDTVHLEGNGLKVLTKNYDKAGSLGPGQSIPLTFSIQAPTRSGLYYPEVWVDVKNGANTKYPIPVNVNTAIGIQKQAILIMDSSLDGSVNPGEEIPVTLTISNAGQLLADDVTLIVTNVSGKLAPKGADLYHLGMIGPGEQKSVSIVLLSDKQAGAGLVRVPVTISYNTIDGRPVSESTGIDVVLKGKAELGFVSVDTSPSRLTENTPFDLTIRIENTGTGEAKQVSAKVDLPADGTKEAFIGKIKPGNDAPAIFLLEGMKGGNYPYTLTIRYTDDMGVHTEIRQMNLRVTPQDNSGSIVLVILVLAVIGILAYRYWYLPRKNGDGTFPWERKS